MIFLIFLFGLLIGSFLNSVIYRSASGGSIFASSSQCPKCGRRLSFLDLIPVLSFLWLKGRCRYCQKPISWQYPLVELTTAISFVLVYTGNVIPAKAGIQEAGNWILTSVRMTDYYNAFFQFIFTSLLIVIFVYDLKHHLILDRMLIPGTILAAAFDLYLGSFWQGALGAVLLAGFFGFLFLVSRGRWIGLGDVKLGVFLGFLIPYPQTLALFFLAYVLGALVSLLLLIGRRKQLRDPVPFGPFLTIAAFLAMLYGEDITKWYLGLIGWQ